MNALPWFKPQAGWTRARIIALALGGGLMMAALGALVVYGLLSTDQPSGSATSRIDQPAPEKMAIVLLSPPRIGEPPAPTGLAPAIAPFPMAGNGAPATDLAHPQQQLISTLLIDADEAFNAMRLSTPEKDSARRYYNQVLLLDPNNEQARKGLKRISGKYVEMAESAWTRGLNAKKRRYLNQASAITPNDPELLEARTRMAKAKPSQKRQTSTKSKASKVRRKTHYPTIRSAATAYKNHKISKVEYRRIKQRYATLMKQEIVRLKTMVRQGKISKAEYKRRVTAVKIRYKG